VGSVTRRGFIGGVLLAGAGAWSSAPAVGQVAAGAAGVAPTAADGAPSAVALNWNLFAQQLLQPTGGMTMGPGTISMPKAFVLLAAMHAAMYDAVVAIEGGYQPYASRPTVPMRANAEAAAVAAAHAVLVTYLPDQKMMLDGEFYRVLSLIPVLSAEKSAGVEVGRAAAAAFLATRVGDGFDAVVTYLPPTGPGAWVSMPTMPPLDPWIAQLRPFTMTAPSQFRPGPPPSLKSPGYAKDLDELARLGGAVSARTPVQTETAAFWTTNGVIQYNDMFRAVAVREGMRLRETARLLAMGNIVGTDSMIATFDSKYHYGFWRPRTAIAMADIDGNPRTSPDPTWMPAFMVPNHPEYVAAHTSFASAVGEVLTSALGTRRIEIDLSSTVTGTTHHYATAEDLRAEVENARVWGGMHFRNSCVLGTALGKQVASQGLKAFRAVR